MIANFALPRGATLPYALLAGLCVALALTIGSASVRAEDIPPEAADLTDDGRVSSRDYILIRRLLGTEAGTPGYREGLDLVPDGVIDRLDLLALRGQYGERNVPTGDTLLVGQVLTQGGASLVGVKVFVGDSAADYVDTCTVAGGFYFFGLTPETDIDGQTGENKIGFDASAENGCGGPVDPTSAANGNDNGLSGTFASLKGAHAKPIRINGGHLNTFRRINLPERDLAGAVNVSEDVDADQDGTNPQKWTLNEPVSYSNAGVRFVIPAGCMVTFPPGEDPVLSITRIPPDEVPAFMPPGASSTIFVTFQPGGTEVMCPGGTEVTAEYDNVDLFDIGPGDPDEGPLQLGFQGDIFVKQAVCEVIDVAPAGVGANDIVSCPLGSSFEFAWYHTDILPPAICAPPPAAPQARCTCPRGNIQGHVRLAEDPMPGVAGATVTTAGLPARLTDASPAGHYDFFNRFAGPNGRNCFETPVTTMVNAGKDLDGNGTIDGNETGFALVVMIPGGTAVVPDIKIGATDTTTVYGKLEKLRSVNPFVREPLVDDRFGTGDIAEVFVQSGIFNAAAATDSEGNYQINGVPLGFYSVDGFFQGTVVPAGGTPVEKTFQGIQFGNFAPGDDPKRHDFRFTSTGSVKITVTDTNGNPVEGLEVHLESNTVELGGRETFGGEGPAAFPLGAGFVAPSASCHAYTDSAGMAVLEGFACESFDFGSDSSGGVPQGPCRLTVGSSYEGDGGSEEVLAEFGPNEGCFMNVHGEQLVFDVVIDPIPIEGDILEAQVIRASSDGVDTLFVDVLFDALPIGTIAGPDAVILVEFDTDQDAATGGPFAVNSPTHGGSDLGVELRVECMLSYDGPNTCTLHGWDPGSSAFVERCTFGLGTNVGGNPSKITAPIPVEVVVDGPDCGLPASLGTADVAIQSLSSGDGGAASTELLGPASWSFGTGVLDTLPNGGSFQANLDTGAPPVADPAGDVEFLESSD